MVERKVVKKVIDKFGKSWVTKDPEAILEIFTEDATYHERVLEKPFVGHSEIRKYWQDKVVGEQEGIKFALLNLFIDRNTAIAEWEVRFRDIKKNQNTHMKEVAILVFRRDKIVSLREYWSSEHK